MGETTNGEDTGEIADDSKPVTSTTPISQQKPDEKIERVDLSTRARTGQPVAPSQQSAQTPIRSSTDIDRGVNDDIARILGEVKLPARNSPAAPAAPDARTYDTALADPAVADAERTAKQANVREAARAVNESLPTKTKRSNDVSALHTLKDDLQHVVRDKKISLVRAVALQEDKKHRPTISPAEELAAAPHPRHTFAIILTLTLFLLGAGALAATYYVLQDRAGDPIAPLASQILFAERAVPLPIDSLAPADIRREIANARNSGSLPLGAIMQIIPVVSGVAGSEESFTPISFGSFITALGAHPPEELVRALSADFFFGIHTVDENAPLFIIPVTSYERAFAGMLEWEKSINNDLAPMFSAVPMQTVGADGVLVGRTFEDAVIRNYDVRILKDERGVIQLYYSFPTRNILIIAESQYSFTELLSRLRADRKL